MTVDLDSCTAVDQYTMSVEHIAAAVENTAEIVESTVDAIECTVEVAGWTVATVGRIDEAAVHTVEAADMMGYMEVRLVLRGYLADNQLDKEQHPEKKEFILLKNGFQIYNFLLQLEPVRSPEVNNVPFAQITYVYWTKNVLLTGRKI